MSKKPRPTRRKSTRQRAGDNTLSPPKPPKPALNANQGAFLAAYTVCACVTEASQVAGVDRTTHYLWMKDPLYQAAFEEAEAKACDQVVREVRRRAIEGWEEPVFHRGQVAGTVLKKSDRMLELLAKAKRPDLFRERHSHEHSGPGGGPVQTEQVIQSDDQILERWRGSGLPIEFWPARWADMHRKALPESVPNGTMAVSDSVRTT